MDYILVSFLSIVAYHFYLVAMYKRRKKIDEEIVNELRAIAKEMQRKVNIDFVDGQFLAYDAKTNAFLTKFDDLTDLAKKLESIDRGAVWMFTEQAFADYQKIKGPINVR